MDDDLPFTGVVYHEHEAEEAGRHHARSIAAKHGPVYLVEHLKTNRESLRRFLRVLVGSPAMDDGAGRKFVAKLTNIAWRAFVDEATIIAANTADPARPAN
ncbi:hypothetical protein [Pleomorphomonas carboxyditropha]|uniref:Uncharacterized protein n=1 Tax=Pleomorphomonas carboxyditropha TaxID=2023338 RepID=A0A2G9WPJ5_9HYPH|nr:hypothetical protein [Pleomorphomonas carboxyditropha]PIO96584.1 hypothetical protein CJ014_24795 [Pleomorphomonas carboxyditropha]